MHGWRIRGIVGSVILTGLFSLAWLGTNAAAGLNRLTLRPSEHVELIPTQANGTLTIDVVHRRGLRHRGVGLLLYNDRGQLLMTRRGAHMRTCPKQWLLPGEHSTEAEQAGGAPHAGEQGTAARCVQEEFGVSISPHRFYRVGEVRLDMRYQDGRRDWQDSQFFAAHVPDFPTTVPATEFDALAWVDAAGVLQLAQESPHRFCLAPIGEMYRQMLVQLCAAALLAAHTGIRPPWGCVQNTNGTLVPHPPSHHHVPVVTR